MWRSLALVPVLVVSLFSMHAAAQAPAPAVAAAGTMEELIGPLADGAEAALAADHPALAVARAQLVLDAVASSSPLAARAQAVTDAASVAMAGGRAPDDTSTALAPMLDAAAASADAGRLPIAEAQIEFVLDLVPATSALAHRAEAIRARMTVAASPTLVASPPEFAGDDFSDAPTSAPVTPRTTPETAAPAAPADPTRRDDAELIETYITMTTFGVYTGFWIPFGAGLQGGNDRNPESLLYSLSILAGGGLFALGVSALDDGPGMRAGVGSSMSAGTRYGVALGFMMWGALDPYLSPNEHCNPAVSFTCSENRAGLSERTALPLAFGATGALVGLGVGLGLRPTSEQVRAVEMGGLWGGAIGLLSSLGAAQSSSQGFIITASGVGLGLLGTAITQGMGIHFGGRRLGFITLGLAAGAAAGLLVPAFGSIGAHGWSWPLFSVTGATALAGMIIAGLVTNGMDEGPSHGPDIHVSLGPTEGGAMASLSGSF